MTIRKEQDDITCVPIVGFRFRQTCGTFAIASTRATIALLGLSAHFIDARAAQYSVAAPPPTPPAAVDTPLLMEPVVGRSQVGLTWSEVEGATYNVYEASNAEDATSVTTPVLQGIKDTKVLVVGLDNDQPQPLYFSVRAVVSGRTSAPSNVKSASPTKNAAPSDLTLTANDGQITLSWTSVGATSYQVFSSTDPTKLTPDPELTAVVGSTYTVAATVTGLQNGITYFFEVKATSGSATTASPVKWGAPVATASSSALTEKPIDIRDTSCDTLNSCAASFSFHGLCVFC